LTILAQTRTDNSTFEKSEFKESAYLPLISSSMATRKCGFSMDKNIFNALLRLDDHDNDLKIKSINKDTKSKNIKNSSKSRIAACIANLYYQDGIIDFEQWVASILVFGWRRLVKYHKQISEQSDKRSRKSRVNCCRIFNLALNLVKHPYLEKLWTRMEGQWVKSFVSFVFLNTPLSVFDAMKNDVNDTENPGFSRGDYLNAILQTLRSLDEIAYERGITHALLKTKTKKSRMDLAKYLGLAKSKPSSYSGIEATNEGNESYTVNSMSLPPRVGLEHADHRVRLESIAALLNEKKHEEHRMGIDDCSNSF
jgi:hypothetical protein